MCRRSRNSLGSASPNSAPWSCGSEGSWPPPVGVGCCCRWGSGEALLGGLSGDAELFADGGLGLAVLSRAVHGACEFAFSAPELGVGIADQLQRVDRPVGGERA